MAVDYIFSYVNLLDEGYVYRSSNDVVFLAPAEGTRDAGRMDGYMAYDSGTTTSRYHFNAMYLNNNKTLSLVFGGNYSLYYPYYNLTYQTNKPRYATAAAFIRNDGIISFASQTGAALASEQNNDDALRFRATTSTRYERGTSYSVDPPTTNSGDVALFESETGSLAVNGSVSGTFTVSNILILQGITVVSGSNATPTNINSDVNAQATVFRTAQNLTVENNMEGTFNVTADGSTFANYGSIACSNDVITASGVLTTGNITMANGEWSGGITTSASNNKLYATVYKLNKHGYRNTDDTQYTDLTGEELNDIRVLASSVTTSTPATLSNNTIGSYGLKADGDISLSLLGLTGTALIVDHETTTIQSTTSDNTLRAEADGGTGAGSVTLSENTLEAIGIVGTNVTIDTVNAGSNIKATASNNSIATHVSGVGSNTNTGSNNVIRAYGITGDAITLGSFDGTIKAKAMGNSTTWRGGVVSTRTDVQAAGLYANNTITVNGNMDGVIETTLTGNTDTYSYSYANSFGLYAADSITVKGQFTTEITGTFSDGRAYQLAYGIKTNTITGAAFSGTITMSGLPKPPGGLTAGISVQSETASLVSIYDDDAFDINGTIDGGTIGFAAKSALNLRVSGSISGSQYAIVTDNVLYDKGVIEFFTQNNPDVLELSDTAVIDGDIELYSGPNTLTINSGATVNGNLLSTYGEINIIFALNENKHTGETIVTTDTKDISLISTASTLTVELADALVNSTYTLFDYGAGANVSDCWKTQRFVTLNCQGDSQVVIFDNNCHCQKVINGVIVSLDYNDATGKLVLTTGAGAIGQETVGTFTATTEVLDARLNSDGNALIKWATDTLAGAKAESYTIEYQIYDENDIAVGGSIVVTVAGSQRDEQEMQLDLHLKEGESVKYRIRSASGSILGAWSEWSDPEDLAVPAVTGLENPNLAMVGTPVITSPSSETGGITSSTVKFSWDNAHTELPIDHYNVVYVTSKELLDIDFTTWNKANGTVKDTNNVVHEAYCKEVTGTSIIASQMSNQSFVIWAVQAVDTAGNASAYQDGQTFRIWKDDVTPPSFTSTLAKYVTVDIDNSDAFDVRYNVTFQWASATDSQSGVNKYIVEYKKNDDAYWTSVASDADTFETSLYDLKGGLYSYRIYAVDYVGNQSAYLTQGTFGSADVTPPDGTFSNINATVTATYEKTEPNTSTGATTKTYTTADVAFTWEDTFEDDSALTYTVEVCADSEFIGKTYLFTTQEKELTLSLGTTGNTSSVFDGGDTFYYRISVQDANGNLNPSYSAINSFDFKDADGDTIALNATIAAPTNLSITTGTGNAALFRWTDASQYGTYQFILEYTYKDNENVKHTEKVTGITTNSYTATSLPTSDYTWKVSALDKNLKTVATTSGSAFTIDTNPPEKISADDVIVANLKNRMVFSWPAVTDDFSGVKHYALRYRNTQSSSWTEMTTTTTSIIADFTSSGNYAYELYAVDKNGNAAEAVTGNFTVNPAADFGDTADEAYVILPGVQPSQTIGGRVDTADYAMFTIEDGSFVTVSVAGVKALTGSSSNGVTVKLLRADAKSVIDSFTVKASTGNGASSVFLDEGTYYVALTPTSSAVNMYDLGLQVTDITQYYTDNNDFDTAQALEFTDGTVTLAEDTNWVGYGDATDMFTFNVDADHEDGTVAGDYTFQLDDAISGFATMTLYCEVDGTTTKLQSLSVTGTKNTFTAKQLLNGATYYIAVISNGATSAKSPKNTNYSLTITASNPTAVIAPETEVVLAKNEQRVFDAVAEGDNDMLLLLIDGTKYTAYTLGNKGSLAKATLVSTAIKTQQYVLIDASKDLYLKSSVAENTLSVTTLDSFKGDTDHKDGADTPATANWTGWVGGTDTNDVWTFDADDFDGAGWVDFSFDNLTSTFENTTKLTATLYKTDMATNKTKSVKSAKLTSSSGASFGMYLEDSDSSSYSLVVSGGTGKNAASFTMNAQKVLVANTTNDTAATATAIALDANNLYQSDEQWVGYGDAADYYAFTTEAGSNAQAGAYTFTLDDVTAKNVKLTLYVEQTNGKLTKVKTFTAKAANASLTVNNLLNGYTYYVAVESTSAKNATSAKTSYYTLSIDGSDAFKVLTLNEATALEKSEYAAYTVGNDDQTVLTIDAAKFAAYTDNGKGGFKALTVVNSSYVTLSAGQTVYVKNTGKTPENVTVTNAIAFNDANDEHEGALIGNAWNGWVGGTDASDTWNFTTEDIGLSGQIDFNFEALQSTFGTSAKLTATLYRDVNGKWTKVGKAATLSSTAAASLSASLEDGFNYKLVVSGGTTKNAASYAMSLA